MDDSQIREMIPPKQQNPLLKKKPLNLGTKFTHFKKHLQEQIQLVSVLIDHSVTLLLFAAEWVQMTIFQCNISKPFIGKLIACYDEINLEQKKMQVIYVSLSKNEPPLKTIPWLIINDERVPGLKEYYDVRSIPTLILLNSKGEEIYRHCRQDVCNLNPDQAYEKWFKIKENI